MTQEADPNATPPPKNFAWLKYVPRVFRYLKPYRRQAALSGVLIVLGGLIVLLAPWPLKIVVDHVLGEVPMPEWLARVLGPLKDNPLWLMVLAVLAGFLITLISNGLTVLDSFLNTNIEQRMVLDFRSEMFQHAQRLSLAFHDSRRSGMLIYAINFQGDAAARMVMIVPPLTQSLISLVGMFWIVLRLDWGLALLSLTVVPFLVMAIRYYVTRIQARLMAVREMEGESLSIIHEMVSMMRVIVAFGREGHEYRRFREQGQRAVSERVKVTVRQTMFRLFVDTTTAAGTALVLGFGAYRVMQDKVTVGELLVMMAYIAAVYNPLEAISTTIGSLQEVFVTMKVAFDLMDVEPEIKDKPGAKDLPGGRARGHIIFEGIQFSYRGRTDTLININLDARPGKVMAIVGPTGAGKSTLVSLIPRFYGAKGGRILLDGQDIRDVTLKSLRQQISIVLQEPLLFSGSIAENIRYGRLEASPEEIVAAAKAAGADEFIGRLPNKYDTLVGERGAQLSGGERQRIAVARAFLKDAPILILDEPTSSIDSKTEAVILDALDRLMVGRTTFMIAHRLSTIRHADRILVMDRGRIVGRGTHDSLVAAGGLYKQLHEMQAGTGKGRRAGKEPVAGPDDHPDDDEFESSPLEAGA